MLIILLATAEFTVGRNLTTVQCAAKVSAHPATCRHKNVYTAAEDLMTLVTVGGGLKLATY